MSNTTIIILAHVLTFYISADIHACLMGESKSKSGAGAMVHLIVMHAEEDTDEEKVYEPKRKRSSTSKSFMWRIGIM